MRRRQRGKQKGAGAEGAQRGSPLSPAGEPEMVEIAESDVMESLRRSQRIVYLKDLVNDEATASQQNFFDVLAATTNEINELEEQESTELREQLRPLKLSELRKRAATLQVDEGQVEDAMDSGDNPKEALIGILVKRHRALFAELEMLQLAELQARAVEEKALTEDEVEDAAVRHGDNAKAALIALLLGRDDWDEPPSQPRDTSAADGSSDAAMGGGGGTPDWRMQMAMAQPEVSGGAAERFDVPPTELPTRTGKKVRFSWGKKSSAGSGGAVAASAAAAAEAQAAALQAQVLLAADRIDGRPPFKEGYLKMGGVRRWFELRSGCVLFFLSERDGDLQGNILFAEAIVITVDDETTQGRHCFDVITPNLFKYRLEATTKNGRDAWLEAVLIQQSERGAMLRGSIAMRSGASDDAASSGRRRGGDAADKSSAAGGKKTPDKKSMSKRELAQLQEQERRVAREERRRRKKIEAEEAAAEAAAAAEAQAEAEAQEAAFVAAQDAFEPELEPEPEPEPTRELEASFSTVGRERTSDRRHRRSGSGGASSTASKVGEMKRERRHRRTSSESSLAGGGALDGPAKGDTGSDTVSQLASVTSGELLDEPTTPPRDAGSDASARGDRTIGASPSQLPHLSQAPLDSVQISTVAAAGMSGGGGSSGTTTAARGVGAATTVGAGAGARGAGKFRALIDAHACISDQQFVVTVKCIHGGMNDDQPPDEAALFVELLDEALEDVDDAVQLEVVDLLRNLLQKVRVILLS